MDLNFREMKRWNYIVLTFFAGITMFSCLPDPLPVRDIPKLRPSIVISSQIIPDQTLVVLLTKSVGALDASNNSDPEALLEQILIDSAVVTLRYENQTDTLINLGSGLYGGIALNWATGINYVLQVEDEELGKVTALASVPQRVPFQSVNAQLYSTGFDSLAQINYGLQDPAGRNFYMVNVQQFSRTQDITSLLRPRVFTHLVNDETFNQQLYQDEFKIFFRDFEKGDSVAVFLSNISEEYYRFLKLRNDNRYNPVGFASEPANYPSNVKGGYGFFNLHVPDVRVFVLE
jgi:Domain of unknown function (DUF4249)